MPLVTHTVFFGSKNFQSGLAVQITAYRLNGTIAQQQVALEVGTIGVYYSILSLSKGQTYVILAIELTGTWKAFQVVNL
jgi:hypothetical protein